LDERPSEAKNRSWVSVLKSVPPCCSKIAIPYSILGRDLLGAKFSQTIKNRHVKKSLKRLSIKKGSLRITDFGYSILKAIEVLDHVMEDPAFHESTFRSYGDQLLETVLRATGESYLPKQLPWADLGHLNITFARIEQADEDWSQEIDQTILYVLAFYESLRLDPQPSDFVNWFGAYGFGLSLPEFDLEVHFLVRDIETSLFIFLKSLEVEARDSMYLLNERRPPSE
jgi:hypothetical protein